MRVCVCAWVYARDPEPSPVRLATARRATTMMYCTEPLQSVEPCAMHGTEMERIILSVSVSVLQCKRSLQCVAIQRVLTLFLDLLETTANLAFWCFFGLVALLHLIHSKCQDGDAKEILGYYRLTDSFICVDIIPSTCLNHWNSALLNGRRVCSGTRVAHFISAEVKNAAGLFALLIENGGCSR